jgi:hypothetical protein
VGLQTGLQIAIKYAVAPPIYGDGMDGPAPVGGRALKERGN